MWFLIVFVSERERECERGRGGWQGVLVAGQSVTCHKLLQAPPPHGAINVGRLPIPTPARQFSEIAPKLSIPHATRQCHAHAPHFHPRCALCTCHLRPLVIVWAWQKKMPMHRGKIIKWKIITFNFAINKRKAFLLPSARVWMCVCVCAHTFINISINKHTHRHTHTRTGEQ